MALSQLEKTEWHAFFDRLSKGLIGTLAEIDVLSLTLGAQVQAQWRPVLGIVYDPKDDLIEIALQDLDHMVRAPQALYVDGGPFDLGSFEIVDGDGVRHMVQFRELLKLPPPQSPNRT